MKSIFEGEERLFKQLAKEGKVKLSSVKFILVFPFLALLVGGLIGIASLRIVYISLGGLSNVFIQPLQLLVTAGISILMVFLVVKRKEKRSIRSLGLPSCKEALPCYLRGWAIGLLMMAIAVGVILLISGGQISFKGLESFQILPFILMLLAWIAQGASEEIVMRGYMFPALSVRVGVKYSLVASSVYFAILHIANTGITPISFMNIVLVGVFTALYAMYEDSIWGVCGWHSAWNFAQGNVFGLEVSGLETGSGTLLETRWEQGNALFTGGVFGPEASVVVTVIFLIGMGVLYILLHKKQK